MTSKTRPVIFVACVFLFLPIAVDVSKAKPVPTVDNGRWEDVLRLVSADVQKNYYDPQMKGLDWAALTEQTRQRINNAKGTGEAILAICVLLDRLQDSHTYFVPPPLTARSDFGFKARAYGDDIRVYEITAKSPAEKAGLQVGEKILALNGVPVDRNNIGEVLRLVTAVVPASSLAIEIASSAPQKRTVHVPARVITMQEHQYIDSVWRVFDRQQAMDVHVNFEHKTYDDGMFYLRIPSFRASPDTTFSEIDRAKSARGLILDLRGNPGGSEATLTSLLGFFAEQPEVLAKRVSRSQSEDVQIAPRKSGFHGSITVLVDSSTGSAAELAARFLQLSRKAVIVGDLTKGAVNEGLIVREKIGVGFVMPFAVVVTHAKLIMSNGEELEGRGVTPDVQCVPTQEELVKSVDTCLDKALALTKK